jgi:hypothetical protein
MSHVPITRNTIPAICISVNGSRKKKYETTTIKSKVRLALSGNPILKFNRCNTKEYIGKLATIQNIPKRSAGFVRIFPISNDWGNVFDPIFTKIFPNEPIITESATRRGVDI